MGRLQHNDEPTLDCQLQRVKFIGSLAEQIATCRPPHVFGVHGEWGAGKTSVLLQLQRHLSAPGLVGRALANAKRDTRDGGLELSKYGDQTFTVWFEAWRYQHEPLPLVALLQEMKRQFSAAVKLQESVKAGGMMALKALTNVFDTAAGLVGAESMKLINPGNILKAAEAYDAEHFRARLPTDTTREFLEGAITELLVGLKRDGSANPRVVVFIDDLDRCSSEAAYRLLESLKIHLNLPNCVFVLGMNQSAVVDLLALHLSKKGDDDIAARRAESYLEKLCANVWRLPPVRDPLALLCHWLFVDGGVQNETMGDADLSKRVEALKNHGVIARSLPPNPRKLKALANTLLMLWNGGAKAAIVKGGALTLECFLFQAYIYQFHQPLYQRWILAPDFFEIIREWASGKALSPKLLAIFEGLEATVYIPSSGDKNAPSVAADSQTLYPEPGQHGLFWMTPWLLHPEGGGLAKSDMFQSLLVAYEMA